MSSGNRAYRLILAASDRAVQDIQRLQVWTVKGFHFLLRKADATQLDYDLAVTEQAQMLTEIKLLGASIDVKSLALQTGGFATEHGPALELVANALYDNCGWDDEDIGEWFAQLVMDEKGVNLGFELELEDEEEDED